MGIIAGMILISCCGANAADTGACTKSYLIQLKITPSGVTEEAVQLVYGYSPLANQSMGSLNARILSANGRVIGAYTLWDTRIPLGEDIVIDKTGNITKFSAIQARETTAGFVVMFPYTADAVSFNLYDDKGMLMKSVDLRKAEDRATWKCTPDYGIPSIRDTRGLPFNQFTLLLVAGVIIAVCAVAGGWYILKKRKPAQK